MAVVKTLEERWAKLKLKEARLEADLAIRDCPELQSSIAEIILAYVDAREAYSKYEMLAPSGPTETKLRAAEAQSALFRSKIAETGEDQPELLAFYKSKLAVVENMVHEFNSPKYLKLRDKYNESLKSFQETYERLKPEFEEHCFKWDLLLPSIVGFLSRRPAS